MAAVIRSLLAFAAVATSALAASYAEDEGVLVLTECVTTILDTGRRRGIYSNLLKNNPFLPPPRAYHCLSLQFAALRSTRP